MNELPEAEFRRKMWEDPHPYAVIFTTPLCGTCRVAKKMLEVAEAAAATVPVHEVNVNIAPALARDYRITSVPCLFLIRERRVWKREYAFHSAVHLYELLKSVIQT